ncbi:ATP-binding protein [Chryseobacterium aquaticum]|uniref:ATP-binding protein n=1 Tax=Chryseobacterium aquaticum TaxID=452084 RepID=A0A848NAM5_9FLAO|nr:MULTISPECIES: ATP-binding protein [Chryseobacterium]NMR36042.1 ATP-binding protein [Chryseobacterium aquaticum]NRQ48117.1 ATP-binding protein [Chryseobacterium sp. C-204]
MAFKSTYLGTIQDVSGTSLSVALDNTAPSGLTYVDGEGYRIGQIGSFVKIPIGYIDLFGIVTQVGASAVPENQVVAQPYGYRWIKVQLIGEGQRNGSFQRGISQYPTISDEVHLVSESDLKKIYGQPDKPYFVKVGHIAGAESIPALIDINKLVTRHSAIVGTTGSGKSTTVASILNAISDPVKYPSARVIVFDLHGEYGHALKDRANIFKVNADKTAGSIEKDLFIPFWALSFEELVGISFGQFSSEKDYNTVLERITNAKFKSLETYPKNGIDSDSLNVDSPIPFSLNHLWHELYTKTLGKFYPDKTGKPLAFEIDHEGNEMKGDPIKATPPVFKPVNTNTANGDRVQHPIDSPLTNSQQLHSLGSKLRIPRFDFLFKPGEWTPAEDGKTEKDLDSLIQEWIGSDKPITIMDLSGVPISILNTIIGVLLRIIYDGLFWARNLSQGGRNRPLLLLMEEAHNYLNKEGTALPVVQKIVKEGRKYGIGAMIVSQRPSEIDSTILSQCGTFFALRLANTVDRGHITSAVTDNLEGLTSMLPILRTGEAIILGEAVKLPMRTLIDAPPRDRRPDSQDPIIYDEQGNEDSMHPGGWGIKMEENPNYEEFLETWRAQSPFVKRITK